MDLKTYIKTYLEGRFKKKWIGIDHAVTLKQLVIYCKKYEVTKSHVSKALKAIMSEPGVCQFLIVGSSGIYFPVDDIEFSQHISEKNREKERLIKECIRLGMVDRSIYKSALNELK